MKLNQSVQRAIAILRAAASQPGGETASALARRTKLPWTTAVRLIRTLEHEGFLQRLPDGDRYSPGFDLLRLASSGAESRMLTALASAPLERLMKQVEETVNLTLVVAGGQLDVVAQFDPPRLIRPANYIGRWFPEHASSIGKLLLASYDDQRVAALLQPPLKHYGPATIVDVEKLMRELARVRRTGYSVTVDELEQGLTAISVGVRSPDGELVAIVSISGPSSRLSSAIRRKLLPHVRQAAAVIEQTLAGRDEDSGRRRAGSGLAPQE
jgi:DNA-binding IclR family transcriptional regulator